MEGKDTYLPSDRVGGLRECLKTLQARRNHATVKKKN